METLAQSPTQYKPGRRAYGSHRTRRPETKARNIAASIRARQAEGRTWALAEYGIEHNAVMIGLVGDALAASPCEA